MLVTGAGNTAGIGTPQGRVPLVSWSAGLTELAGVSLGARTSLHPGGWWGQPPPGGCEPDLSQKHGTCREREREGDSSMHVFLHQTFLLTCVTGHWPTFTKAVDGSIAIKKKGQRAQEKLVTFRRRNMYGWEFYKKTLTLTGY